MNFVGNARRRTAEGLRAAAALVGCDVAALHADVQVEASSSGFDRLNRPKMLFEPHLFYRNIRPSSRSVAVSQGLAYQRWGTRPYPADSYPRLAAAMRLDPEAALKSASWGLPQILGSNCRSCGYETVGLMVSSFVNMGEDEQLMAMARFIKSNPAMHRALVAHDWTAFARLYNGASTRGYDTKLADAYRHVLVISPEEANREVVVAKAKSRGVVKTTQSVATAVVAAAVPAVAVIANTHASHYAWPWVVGGVLAAFAAIDAVAAVAWFKKRAVAEADPHPTSALVVTPLPAATAQVIVPAEVVVPSSASLAPSLLDRVVAPSAVVEITHTPTQAP